MYTITFEDGTVFEGGSPAESKWGEIPNKSIQSILYQLTPFIAYKFSNFDSYNHCVERVRGVNNNIEMISKVIIMGRTKNRIYQIMMDSSGRVYQMVVQNGHEYSSQSNVDDTGKFKGWINGKPLTGWVKGVESGEPKLETIRKQ